MRLRRWLSMLLLAALPTGLLAGAVEARQPRAPGRPAPAAPATAQVDQQRGSTYQSTPAWWIETVDSGSVGNYSSLALDPAGRPHVSYYDHGTGALKYAYKDVSGWHVEAVDTFGNMGGYTSLALDSNGRPHITYCQLYMGSTTNCDDLRYAWHDGSDWHIEIVDGEFADVGAYNSLVLWSDRPHISYYDSTNGDLKYAYKDSSGAPHFEIVDSAGDAGQFTSLALSWGGRRYISYYGNGDLRYAHYDGSSWNTETVTSTGDVGYYTSLALYSSFPSRFPRISYYDATAGELWYAYEDSFGWHFELVDGDPCGPTSLALDGSFQPHVSYFEQYGGDLRYAHREAAGWQVETVDDDGDVWPYWSSLALDGSDRPHISYYDDGVPALRYAYKPFVVHLPLVLRNDR